MGLLRLAGISESQTRPHGFPWVFPHYNMKGGHKDVIIYDQVDDVSPEVAQMYMVV